MYLNSNKTCIVYCKSFMVENFAVFTDRSVTVKLFQWNSLCNRLCPCNTTIQPWMFSSELQFSSVITKLFHREWFAIYGTHQMTKCINHATLFHSPLCSIPFHSILNFVSVCYLPYCSEEHKCKWTNSHDLRAIRFCLYIQRSKCIWILENWPKYVSHYTFSNLFAQLIATLIHYPCTVAYSAVLTS